VCTAAVGAADNFLHGTVGRFYAFISKRLETGSRELLLL
jgi:hypothetical protein